MKANVQRKMATVFSYPFLQSVGRPLPPSVTAVSHWKDADMVCSSPKWEACRLMARNALQMGVNKRNWNRLQEWNPLVKELRPVVRSFVDSILSPAPLNATTHKNIMDCISWDLMGIFLELEYSDIVDPIFFIPMLEPWYEAGYFPCGWNGDEFPDDWDGVIRGGQLVVF